MIPMMIVQQEPVFEHLVVSFDGSVTPVGSVATLKNLQGAMSNTGTARNAVNANAATQPDCVAGVKAGKNAIRYTRSSGDYLISTFGISIAAASTFFFVGKARTNATGSNFNYYFSGIGATTRHDLVDSGATGLVSYRTNTYVGGSTADTNAHIFSGYGGEDGKLYVDGSLAVSGNFGTQSLGGLTLGARYTLDNNGDIDIYDLRYYNGILSDTKRKALERFFANKWDIQIV